MVRSYTESLFKALEARSLTQQPLNTLQIYLLSCLLSYHLLLLGMLILPDKLNIIIMTHLQAKCLPYKQHSHFVKVLLA